MNIAKMESMNSIDANVISENELLMAFAILGPLFEKFLTHNDELLLEKRAAKAAFVLVMASAKLRKSTMMPFFIDLNCSFISSTGASRDTMNAIMPRASIVAGSELDLNNSVMFNDVSGAAAVAKTISTETRVNNTSTKEM